MPIFLLPNISTVPKLIYIIGICLLFPITPTYLLFFFFFFFFFKSKTFRFLQISQILTQINVSCQYKFCPQISLRNFFQQQNFPKKGTVTEIFEKNGIFQGFFVSKYFSNGQFQGKFCLCHYCLAYDSSHSVKISILYLHQITRYRHLKKTMRFFAFFQNEN